MAGEVRAALGGMGLFGKGVLAAVSGGLDSTCLARVLAGLVAEGVISRLELAHVDHRLRPESGEDAAFCAELASSLGVGFHLLRLGGEAFPPGCNVQAQARRLRREWFDALRRERGLDAVALAHHADDQAETVLFRLLRGTGPRGAAGMRPWSPPWARPLLGVFRDDLLELARREGWTWREDASNRQLKYARNRVRRELLPAARKIAPGAVASLLRFAQLAREDDEVLTLLALEEFGRLARREPEGFRLEAGKLLQLAPALRRRVLLAACREAGGEPERLSAAHVGMIEALLGDRGARAHREAPAPAGVRFVLSYGDLWILRPDALTPAPLPEWGREAGHGPAGQAPPGAQSAPLAEGRPRGAVTLRRRVPGDRLDGRKVKDLLMEAAIPRWRREAAVVAEDAEGIFALFADGRAWALEGASPERALWIAPPPRR